MMNQVFQFVMQESAPNFSSILIPVFLTVINEWTEFNANSSTKQLAYTFAFQGCGLTKSFSALKCCETSKVSNVQSHLSDLTLMAQAITGWHLEIPHLSQIFENMIEPISFPAKLFYWFSTFVIWSLLRCQINLFTTDYVRENTFCHIDLLHVIFEEWNISWLSNFNYVFFAKEYVLIIGEDCTILQQCTTKYKNRLGLFHSVNWPFL